MVKSSLQEFLETGKLNGNYLILTVVNKIEDGKYIVGDKSSLGVLDLKNNGKEMKSGTGIKLIKPIHVDKYTLQCHPHFSPAKTLENEKINPEEEEIKRIESKVKQTADTKQDENNLTVEEIKKMSPSTMIQKVNFLVISVSRIIQTKSGQYQICGLKDIDGIKICINLYDKYMNSLEVGKVFTAEKIKKLFNIKRLY